jgi:hypothetical protein
MSNDKIRSNGSNEWLAINFAPGPKLTMDCISDDKNSIETNDRTQKG